MFEGLKLADIIGITICLMIAIFLIGIIIGALAGRYL